MTFVSTINRNFFSKTYFNNSNNLEEGVATDFLWWYTGCAVPGYSCSIGSTTNSARFEPESLWGPVWPPVPSSPAPPRSGSSRTPAQASAAGTGRRRFEFVWASCRGGTETPPPGHLQDKGYSDTCSGRHSVLCLVCYVSYVSDQIQWLCMCCIEWRRDFG